MDKPKKRGRPALYETPEQLQAAVDQYFEGCEGELLYDKKGNPLTDRQGNQRRGGKPPTVSGLSMALGFKDRQTFSRQRRRSLAFNDVVLEARSRIEEFWERALFNGDTYLGAVFMLVLCFGWNRSDTTDPQQIGGPIVRVINRPQEKPTDTSGEQMAVHSLNIKLMD